MASWRDKRDDPSPVGTGCALAIIAAFISWPLIVLAVWAILR